MFTAPSSAICGPRLYRASLGLSVSVSILPGELTSTIKAYVGLNRQDCRSHPDCIIATRGYDFREGQG
jgi:hypothetical protein